MSILEGSMLWDMHRDATVEREGKGMVKTLPSPEPEENAQMRRPKNTELAVDPHVAQWTVRFLTRVMATYAIGVGLAILIGGERRFAGLSYEAALATPGAPASWGVTILLAGLLAWLGTLLGQPRVVLAGTFLGALWALLFASAFMIAAFRYDEANTTGMWVYGMVAVAFASLAGVHYSMRPFRRGGTDENRD